MTVPFMDLSRQIASLRPQLDAAIAECIDTCSFIQGERVRHFEMEFAASVEAKHAIGCGSGTDALYLALKALRIGPGDEVILPALTFGATPEAVLMAGATPVIVDVDANTHLLSLPAVARAATARTRAVIFVNLYGQISTLHHFSGLCGERGWFLIADAAQAHGARLGGVPTETFADITCYSFFPGKNLGAFGDAGACTCNDDAWAADIARRRDHGRSSKHTHDFSGVNMRMDELQAAVLSVKLPHLPAWTARRQEIAAQYHTALGGLQGITVPSAKPADSVWHLYVLEAARRDELAAHLSADSVSARVPYPRSLSQQPAFRNFASSTSVAESKTHSALALPVFESMTEEEVLRVIHSVQTFVKTAP